jgi:hypothetical protein
MGGPSTRLMYLNCSRHKPGNRKCLGFFAGNIGKCSLIAASARFSNSIAWTSRSRSALFAADRCIVRAKTNAATEGLWGPTWKEDLKKWLVVGDFLVSAEGLEPSTP